MNREIEVNVGSYSDGSVLIETEVTDTEVTSDAFGSLEEARSKITSWSKREEMKKNLWTGVGLGLFSIGVANIIWGLTHGDDNLSLLGLAEVGSSFNFVGLVKHYSKNKETAQKELSKLPDHF